MFWAGLILMLLSGLLGSTLFCAVICKRFPRFSDRKIQITVIVILFLSAALTVCEHLQENTQRDKSDSQLRKLENELSASRAAAADQDLIETTIPDVRISIPPRICSDQSNDKVQPEWEVVVESNNSVPFAFFPSFFDAEGKKVLTEIYFEIPKFFPQEEKKPIKLEFAGPYTEEMKKSTPELPWELNLEFKSIYQDKNPSLKLTRTMKALFYFSESDHQIHLVKPTSASKQLAN